MAKVKDDDLVPEMPDFTPEQVEYVLKRLRMTDEQRKSTLGMRERNKSVPAYIGGAGIVFAAMGLWDKFPPAYTIACMSGRDPFEEEARAIARREAKTQTGLKATD